MRTATALLLCGGLAALAAARVGVAATGRVPAVTIGRASGPVPLDGDLSGPVWLHAPSIGLIQQNPHPGKPTRFTTTMRLPAARLQSYLSRRAL